MRDGRDVAGDERAVSATRRVVRRRLGPLPDGLAVADRFDLQHTVASAIRSTDPAAVIDEAIDRARRQLSDLIDLQQAGSTHCRPGIHSQRAIMGWLRRLRAVLCSSRPWLTRLGLAAAHQSLRSPAQGEPRPLPDDPAPSRRMLTGAVHIHAPPVPRLYCAVGPC